MDTWWAPTLSGPHAIPARDWEALKRHATAQPVSQKSINWRGEVRQCSSGTAKVPEQMARTRRLAFEADSSGTLCLASLRAGYPGGPRHCLCRRWQVSVQPGMARLAHLNSILHGTLGLGHRRPIQRPGTRSQGVLRGPHHLLLRTDVRGTRPVSSRRGQSQHPAQQEGGHPRVAGCLQGTCHAMMPLSHALAQCSALHVALPCLCRVVSPPWPSSTPQGVLVTIKSTYTTSATTPGTVHHVSSPSGFCSSACSAFGHGARALEQAALQALKLRRVASSADGQQQTSQVGSRWGRRVVKTQLARSRLFRAHTETSPGAVWTPCTQQAPRLSPHPARATRHKGRSQPGALRAASRRPVCS